jgi:type II secretory pathway predicted ATPase ExeA
MYLSHFGLARQPFSITPDLSFFFAGNKRGEILDGLIYAVLNGDGIIKVTGEVGCGKTMLCRMLESRLPDYVEVIYLINPTLTSQQVIFTIAGELELPVTGKRIDEVIRMLHTALISKHISGKQVVLLIEEAQAMSLETLEEIRLFSNLETAHHKLLQIVMFGQPELDEHLNIPAIRQLKERITNSFIVPPLKPTSVPDYLMFRLRAAGYHGPDLFSRSAIRLISSVSEGIIRRISILADKALLAAYADDSNLVESKHVRAAIEDSEFPKTVLMRRKIIAAVCTLLLMISLGAGWRFAAINSAKAPVKLAVAPVKAPAPAAVIIQPAPVPAATKPAAMPEVQPPVSTADLTLDQRLQRTNSWLNEQETSRFSIQVALVASADQGEIKRFLHKMESETGLQDVYVYSSAKNPHFGIVLGSYASRAEAVKVLNQIAAQWGYQPQLRTIGGIKREMSNG